MADKDLSVNIGVSLDFDENAAAKQLDSLAKKLGMRGKDIVSEIGIKINITNAAEVKGIIDDIEATLRTLYIASEQRGVSLGKALAGTPERQARLIDGLKQELNLIERINNANAQATRTSAGNGNSKLNLKQRIAQDIFSDPNQDFEVARFTRPDNLKAKSYAKKQISNLEKDLQDIESIDLSKLTGEAEALAGEKIDKLEAAIFEVNDAVDEFMFGSGELSDSLNKLNNYLSTAAAVATTIISNDQFELLPESGGFKAKDLDYRSQLMQDEALSLSQTLGAVADGFRVSEEDLMKVQNIKFKSDLSGQSGDLEKPVIDAVTFLNAFNKVLEENTSQILGIGNVPEDWELKRSNNRKDFKPYTTPALEELPMVAGMWETLLPKVLNSKDGVQKLNEQVQKLQTKIFDIITERALKAANSAGGNLDNYDQSTKEYKRATNSIYGYAPSGLDIGGGDNANLRRYMDEAAARSIYESEQFFGLKSGTYVQQMEGTFSKLFGDIPAMFAGSIKDAEYDFTLEDLIRAANQTTFIDRSGAGVMGSGQNYDRVPKFGDQLRENPVILSRAMSAEGSPGVSRSAIQKKFEKNLETFKVGDFYLPDAGKMARTLAFMQSFVDQAEKIKIIKNALPEGITSLEGTGTKNVKDPGVGFIGPIEEKQTVEEKLPRTLEERAADKAYGQAQAKLIAKRRDRIRKDAEAFDKAWDEAHAEEARRNSGAPAVVESRPEIKANVQKRVAKKVKAVEKQIEEAAAAEVKQDSPAAEPFTLKDNKPRLREIIGREKLLQGEALAVGVDTEFNPKLNQNITEFSAIIKTATGEFVKLVDFIHMPLDRANLALDPSPAHVQAANSPEKLIERAKTLGYNAQDIGDTTDVEVNRRLMAQRAKEISDMFEVLAEYDVAITGSKLANAEGASIRKFINYVNTFVEGMAGTTIPQPDVLRKAFDSSKEFGLLDRNSDLASRLPSTPTGKSETKLQTIFAMMAKDFGEFFSNFSSVMRMTDSGPRFTSAASREMTPHFAQADAMASIVVRELFRKFAPAAESTKATPATKSSAGSGGGGKIPPEPPTASAADDPMGERKANALARAFYSQNEYTKMLSKLTSEEKDLIARRLQDLKANGEQIAISAAILEKETKLAQLRANMKGLRGADYSAAREEIRKLDAEVIKLTRSGERNEEAVIAQVLAEGRHKKVTEQLTENARKQFDLAMQRDQAGKNFSVQIQAQLKAELEAQKAVQKANREQINQWVTGRYALYDVGNFYQNLSQQMFRLSRQIFNTTQVYRSFETAFTSVERAMQISGSAAIGMRDQFVKLSETLPVTFEDLSKIATLGAQMGIGAGGIKDFTATVAKFSAITTISADTVAQKFGRIAELAKIDSSEFQNLGSAVAFAGVNAVATESEILTLSESIAAVSTQAGLTPAEIIGMSTALASVGIQAEQARGVFTRVFADINRAVSRGGSELDAFAKVSGMSSEDFAKQWGTEGQSYNVFRKLLGGLGSSSDATKAFDALNIVETREVNTLTRLAESLGVVDQAVSDSNQSFADGTFLAASFEKTADNLDAQLIIFKNNVDSLVVSITQSLAPGLKEVLKFASGFIEVLKLGSKSSVVQWALPLGLGITAVGAAATAAVAGVSKLIAQIYAFRVANINAMNSSATDINGPINRIKQLTGAYSGLIEVRSGLKGVAGPEVKGLVTPVTFKARDIISGQREAFAEFAKTRSFASAMNIMNSTRENALMESANILMISANKNEAGSIALARQQADAVQRIVDARRQEIAALAEKGALGGLSEAELLSQKFFIKLTKTGAEVIDDATAAEIRRTAAAKGATAAQIQEAAAIKMVNAETQTATKAVGLGFTGILNKLTGFLGVVGIIGTVVSMVDMLRVSLEEANKIDLLGSGGSVQSLRDAMTEDTKIWRETGKAISTVKSEYEVYEPVVYAAHDAVKAISGVNKDLKSTTGEVTDSVKSQTIAIGQNTKEWMLNAIIANDKVNGWLEKNPTLFNDAESALQDYGTSFADVMKSVLSDPEGGQEIAIGKITTAIDKNKMALIARGRELVKIKPDSSMADFLKDPAYFALVRRERAMQKIITLVPEMSGALKEGLNKSGFMASMKEIFNEAFGEDLPDSVKEGTQKAAKTLTQWSGEVAQIISSALEIRSQKTTALDGITKAWSDLRKKADDAKKAVKKAQDQINSLKANRSTLEYQLNIAIKYGDSKRATEIQAKLDENTTSLSDANEQLAEAQKNASTELKGNSDAAIDNRATLRSLVNTYVPYIQALENSTVKGETFAQKQERIAAKVGVLKKEFESQALALGFAQKDLAAYLGDFDAMATIVKKVPNTVTVKIDGLPAALRALREFASSANTELGKIKLDDKAKDAALIKGYDDQISVLKFQAQAVNENKALSAAGRASSLSIIGNTIRDLVSKMAALKAKTYATGGYVSGAGTGTSDSIPARLSNGEFVMSAKSVGTYGVDFMNALNQSRVMYAPATPQASQASGGSSVVYLSPDDRALLRAAIDRPVNLYADSTRLAQSVNNGNKVLAQRGSI